MFKPNEEYEVDRRFLKSDYVRGSLAEISTKDTPNSRIDINKHREDSVVSLLNRYLYIKFEVIKNADKNRYDDGNDIRLVFFGPLHYSVIFN